MMFMYFARILPISGLKLDFYGFPGPWDNFNPVRIALSSKLPQDLHQIVESCPWNDCDTFEKVTFNTFVKN